MPWSIGVIFTQEVWLVPSRVWWCKGFLKYEIEALKCYFNQSSSCDLISENDMLHQKVEALTQELAKFVQGSENLNKLLGQQRCAINTAGLGHYKHD